MKYLIITAFLLLFNNLQAQKVEIENVANFAKSLDISAPARRALENADITTLQELSSWSEKEIMKLHEIGKTSIPILQNALNEEKLNFKIDNKNQ